MPGIELKELPELPEDKANSLRKNWWLYALLPLLSFLSAEAALFVSKQEQKTCNDQLIRTMDKLDSTNRSNMEYIRLLLKESDKRDAK